MIFSKVYNSFLVLVAFIRIYFDEPGVLSISLTCLLALDTIIRIIVHIKRNEFDSVTYGIICAGFGIVSLLINLEKIPVVFTFVYSGEALLRSWYLHWIIAVKISSEQDTLRTELENAKLDAMKLSDDLSQNNEALLAKNKTVDELRKQIEALQEEVEVMHEAILVAASEVSYQREGGIEDEELDFELQHVHHQSL